MLSHIFLATLVIHFWQVADANAKSGEQVESKNHLTCEYSGKPYQFSKEVEVIWPCQNFMNEITSELLYQTEVLINMLVLLIWIDAMRQNGILSLMAMDFKYIASFHCNVILFTN